MGDISNKSLAALLVVAIVVSVAGTWMVVNQGTGIMGVTGKASDDATASATISGIAGVTTDDGASAITAAATSRAVTCTFDQAAGTSVNCDGGTLVGLTDYISFNNTASGGLAIICNLTYEGTFPVSAYWSTGCGDTNVPVSTSSVAVCGGNSIAAGSAVTLKHKFVIPGTVSAGSASKTITFECLEE